MRRHGHCRICTCGSIKACKSGRGQIIAALKRPPAKAEAGCCRAPLPSLYPSQERRRKRRAVAHTARFHTKNFFVLRSNQSQIGICIKNVTLEYSSDLSSGRRPESKSDEYLKSTKLVIEIISVLLEIVRRLAACTEQRTA